MIRVLLLSCVLCALAAALHAEILEIPITEFEGSYDLGSNYRVFQLDLGTPLVAVNGASLELTATVTFGTGHGDGEWIPWDEWFDWAGGFDSGMPDPDPGFWMAAFGYLEGQTTQTEEYESMYDATWDFLLDGTGEVYLEFAPVAVIGGIMVVPPSATVESATLILDVIYQPISSQESTWGRIRALLR